MKFVSVAVALLLSLNAVSGQECGSDGEITIGGSSSGFPLSQNWADGYGNACENEFTITEDDEEAQEFGRVCAVENSGEEVMIENRSSDWEDDEAERQENGWTFSCLEGDTNKSIAQLPVAREGIAVVVRRRGAGDACLSAMEGLTLDQLRWIFSSYTERQLQEAGWDPRSIPNLDDSDNNRKWIELDESCPDADIKVAGLDSSSDISKYFAETIFLDSDDGETFTRITETFETSEDVIAYLDDNEDAIAFVGFLPYETASSVSGVPIENEEGDFVEPDIEAINDGSYNPLSRTLYKNLNIDADDLSASLPFVEFGYTEEGDSLTEEVGLIPLPGAEKAEIELQRTSRLNHDNVWSEDQKSSYWCGPEGQSISIAGSTVIESIMGTISDSYVAQCPDYEFVVEAGGSTSGAERVCGVDDQVTIGTMSRPWRPSEAVPGDEGTYDCVQGDVSVTQLLIGSDGAYFFVNAGGAAFECIASMGGLTMDQLRWMLSNYSEEELIASGWDPSSIGSNADEDEDGAEEDEAEDEDEEENDEEENDEEEAVEGREQDEEEDVEEEDETSGRETDEAVESRQVDGDAADETPRLWSQLNPRCPDVEIKLAGPGEDTAAYALVLDLILTDSSNGENIDPNRFFTGDRDEIVEYVAENEDSIGFLDFGNTIEDDEGVISVPIMNDDEEYVQFSDDSALNGSYMLVLPFYLNINNDELSSSFYFMRYAFSSFGMEAVESEGYIPVSKSPAVWQENWERVVSTSSTEETRMLRGK